MQIGQLNKRITIEEKTVTDDGYGGGTESWSKVNDVWANIEPLRGREFYEGQKISSNVDHVIKIRQPFEDTSGTEVRPDHTMRITFDNRTFGIEYVQDLGMWNDYYEIRAREDAS